MHTRAILTTSLLIFAALSGSSCDARNAAAPVPIDPRALPPGVWYLNTANDSSLPVKIASRSVGVALEETFLDSARLTIEYDGFWKQRYWLRVIVSGSLDRSEVVLDEGVWGPPFSATYAFNSTARMRTFSASALDSTTVRTTEPMLTWIAAPVVSGHYRPTRP